MISDFHVHTCMSADSEADIDRVIGQAVSLGMSHLCITDHHDIDFENNEFLLNPAEYYHTLLQYKEKYRGQITLLIGVEMGLQPQVQDGVAEFLKAAPFDFVIGSTHAVDGSDPYYPEFWQGKSTESVMNRFFEATLENVRLFKNYDVYGHLDYAIRYAKEMDRDYSYAKYKALIDPILHEIIARGKGIEINTGGLRKGLRSTNPCKEIIKAYREFGGTIITVGSDAHTPEDIGADFDAARKILTECGFDYYNIFIGRQPVKITLKEPL